MKTKTAVDAKDVFWLSRGLGVFDGRLVEQAKDKVLPITEATACSKYHLSNTGGSQSAAWGNLEIFTTPWGEVVKKMIHRGGACRMGSLLWPKVRAPATEVHQAVEGRQGSFV